MAKSLQDRIATRTTIADNGCHVWEGSKDRKGYAYMSIDGRNVRLSRYISGATSDQITCHTCDNPSCVNPDHLFLGSQRDNMQDMTRKGRHACQQKTHCRNGHEYVGENISIAQNGARRCRTCSRQRALRRRREAGVPTWQEREFGHNLRGPNWHARSKGE